MKPKNRHKKHTTVEERLSNNRNATTKEERIGYPKTSLKQDMVKVSLAL